jgi:hypothetical protein
MRPDRAEPSDYGRDVSGRKRVDFTPLGRAGSLPKGSRTFRVSEDHGPCCHNPQGRHYEDEPDTCCHSHVLKKEPTEGIPEEWFEETRGWTTQIQEQVFNPPDE